MQVQTRCIAASLLGATLLLAACDDGSDAIPADGGAEVACADRNPLRNLYFGDLHVHSALSFDAWAFDVRNGPDEAYRFALGEAVSLPPLDAAGAGTQSLRLERPLDFAAVTEHAEFLGEVAICLDPAQPGYDATLCETYRNNGPTGQTLLGVTLTRPDPARDPGICADGERCLRAALSVWEEIIASAARFDDDSPACAFTTFVAYEYTANTGASAQHRNVIFASDAVPAPVSYFEAPTADALWAALRRDCLEAGTGCDVLAIPHNSNQSNGNTFATRGDAAVEERRQAAEQRAAIEPLLEVFQHKGDSECSNGLGFPQDELCDFEKLREPPLEDCGDGTGSGGVANAGCVSRRDFLRGVLLAGLEERSQIGANPFRLGVIGSTDTHNGTPGAVAEGDWRGHRGSADATPESRLGPPSFRGGAVFNPGGLAAVWAEENSRPSLFAALKRREVYGTSGPRIAARLFAGWDFDAGLCEAQDAIGQAYERGVPMGGVLSPVQGAGAPALFAWASMDPGTDAQPGTPLQRLQIVKGWLEGGEQRLAVYDVAGDPDNGAGVDDQCRPQGSGFSSLCAVWRDPDFSPSQEAFYYARVIENPSCRWNALQCLQAAAPGELAACSDPTVPRAIQERAWTSPIWYEAP